jgi:hypothetical protein
MDMAVSHSRYQQPLQDKDNNQKHITQRPLPLSSLLLLLILPLLSLLSTLATWVVLEWAMFMIKCCRRHYTTMIFFDLPNILGRFPLLGEYTSYYEKKEEIC